MATVAGQSAGGSACATLLGVPAARGLFCGAVCMSGSAALRQTADGVRAVAAQMARHLGVPVLSRTVLEELPAETILAAQEAVIDPDSYRHVLAGVSCGIFDAKRQQRLVRPQQLLPSRWRARCRRRGRALSRADRRSSSSWRTRP